MSIPTRHFILQKEDAIIWVMVEEGKLEGSINRPWELYQKIFLQLLERYWMQVGGRKKFRFKNKLVSLDSTTIDLCLSIFDWARFRRTKGAIKVHLLLDHDGYLPEFAWITEGKIADVKVAQQLRFAPGTIVVDDRGYPDYTLWGRWCS